MNNARKLLAVALSATLAYAAPPSHAEPVLEWMQVIGEANYGGIATDGQGNVYFGGETDDILPASLGGTGEGFLAKCDAEGVIQWTTQPDNSLSVRDISFSQAGDVYSLGHAQGRMFIAKYDTSGTLLQQFDLTAREGGVTFDGLDNIYAGGSVLIDDLSQEREPLLNKYDPSGVMEWSRQFNPDERANADLVTGITTDGLGNVYVAVRTIPLRGEEPYYEYSSVTKFNASGTFQWSRQFGSSERVVINDIEADNSGNIFATGRTTGATWGELTGYSDAFLVNLDANGTVQWGRQFTSTTGDQDGAGALSTDGRGNVYVAGGVAVDLEADPDEHEIWVAKFDTEGTLYWNQQYDLGSQYPTQVPLGITADGLGNLYVSGYARPRAGWPLNSDGFIAKFVDPQAIPEPATIWLVALGAIPLCVGRWFVVRI